MYNEKCLFIEFQNGRKRFLRHFHLADLAHALFALFLFFEQFTLSRDVTAVTLGQHVFSQCTDCFPGNDFPPTAA
jgi:hypothetical protein